MPKPGRLEKKNIGASFSQAIFVFALFVVVLPGYAKPAVGDDADWIIFNGKVATMDEKPLLERGSSPYGGRLVEAVAIKGDLVVGVGTNDEMLKLAGPNTKKLDVKGRTVLPGLIDPHWHITGFVPEDFPEARGIPLPPSLNANEIKKGIEEAIKKQAQVKKPGEWIIVNPIGDVARQLILFEEIKRADLDRLAPAHPVMLNESGSGPNSQILFNSKAREIIEREFALFKKFSDQDIKGDGVNLSGMILKDIILKGKDQEYAESLKKYLMNTVPATGVTTAASRVLRTPLNAYFLLDRRGEMPVRFGWLFSDGSYYNPEGFYKRFPNMAGVGSKYLWNVGVGEEVVDSPSTGLCTTAPIINRELKERFEKSGVDTCFLHNPIKRATVKDQIQYGRGVEYHSDGDKTTDYLLEIIEEIRRETGMTAEQIREKRLTMEHVPMTRADQLPKLKEYGITMGITPGSSANSILDPTKPSNILQNYGETYLKWYMTGGSFVRSGINTVISESFGEPFVAMKLLVSREWCFTPVLPGQGEIGVEKCKIVSPEEKVDRATALKMSTTWASYYVLKEKEVGSLEVGKFADMVVIDQDYFKIPDKEISNIKVLMTVLGGEIVYASPNFGPVDPSLFKSPEYADLKPLPERRQIR
ncbi:MAG: amidohydrolase family protein [Acidobacteria bacterium]|nr:amidohydrolase family protein [Acidobacteriota bacterium]